VRQARVFDWSMYASYISVPVLRRGAVLLVPYYFHLFPVVHTVFSIQHYSHSSTTYYNCSTVLEYNTYTMSNDGDEREEGEGEEDEMQPQLADLQNASVPNQLRGIRACKRCGLLKTLDQFIDEGCDNCPFLDMVR